MPTAARLVAAVLLGALAWVASDIVRGLMPDHTRFGWFNWVNLALGILCGWVVIGNRVGLGYVASFATGLTGGVALFGWAVFIQSFNEMLRLALDRRYDGPMEAVVAIFQIGLDYVSYLGDIPLFGTLFFGSIIAGILAEFAHRRWP